MSRFWATGALVAGVLLAACGGGAPDEAATPPAEGPATELPAAGTPQSGPVLEGSADTTAAGDAAAAEGVVYVDVRTPEEYATGHVVGAINIPHDQMQARWQELAEHKDDRVVVYCRTGRRSGMAKEVLQSQGFENVINGINAEQLQAQGVPVE